MIGIIAAISGDITDDYVDSNGKCPSGAFACYCNNGKHPSLPTSDPHASLTTEKDVKKKSGCENNFTTAITEIIRQD